MSEPREFVKKPVKIQAIQMSKDSFISIHRWLEENGYPSLVWDIEDFRIRPEDLFDPAVGPDVKPTKGVWINPADGCIMIRTLEGDMKVSDGDWVIRGVKGEFYPCKHDIFMETYQEVTDV